MPRPDHRHRPRPARGDRRAVHRARPARRRRAGRRAGGHPRAAHPGRARRARQHDPEGLQEAVEQAMASIGMQVQTSLEVADDPGRRAGTRRTSSWCSAARCTPGRSGRVARAARPTLGVNIEAINRIADYPVTGLELWSRRCRPAGRPPGTLRTPLVEVGARRRGRHRGRAGRARPAGKRLIVFDVDSTLITGEVIEMLAAQAGARGRGRARSPRPRCAASSTSPSRCAARVAMLAGLPASVLDEVGARAGAHPGRAHHDPHAQAARLPLRHRVRRVHPGHRGIWPTSCALDFAAANTLEVVDGRLTGRVVGEIVDRPGKARALERFAREFGRAARPDASRSATAPTTSTCSPPPGSASRSTPSPRWREVADTTLSPAVPGRGAVRPGHHPGRGGGRRRRRRPAPACPHRLSPCAERVARHSFPRTTCWRRSPPATGPRAVDRW